jgi:cytochrome bd-type quinol oxidase subunit 2
MALTLSPLDMLPLFSLASLLAMKACIASKRDAGAFIASCAFIATLLIEAAATLFPYLLPARPLGQGGISIFDAQPGPVALVTAIVSTLAGLCAVIVYGSFAARRMLGKLHVDE